MLVALAFIVAVIAANPYARRAIGNSMIWRPENEG